MIGIPPFEGKVTFQTYDEITHRIKGFNYKIIGKDQSGQYDMYMVYLGTPSNPTMLITSVMHGTEWQGAQYGLSFMEMLRDNTFHDKLWRNKLLDNFHIIYIPVVNPWGLENTTPYALVQGRYNSTGTDLNRDFDNFTQAESRNVRDVILKYKPFAYLDLHLQGSSMAGNQGNNIIIGHGQNETTDIRDEIAESLEIYAGQPVTRWGGGPGLKPGLSRTFVRNQPNEYTPHTLSYINELTRPIERDNGMDAPLSDEQIYSFGMASIYAFFDTSIDYFNRFNYVTEPIVDNTMYVRDLNGREYHLQATTTHDFELNGNQSISFTVLPTKANNRFISDISEMWEVIDDNDVVHKIVYCKKQGIGLNSPGKKRLKVEVKAIPLFFHTLDNNRIYKEYNEHMTAQLAFSRIFEGMPFKFIIVGNFNAVQWEGFGAGESRLETFKRALERYKMEFRIVGNIVYLEHRIGRDTSIQYRHKLNASNIVKEIDGTGFWTYAKGYGDYGNEGEGEGETSDWQDAKLVREYTSPLAKIPGIGILHAPPIKDGRITDKTTMDKSLKTLVEESLKISVTADIHDLSKQGYPIAQSQVGDRVFLIDERIDSDDEVRVISQSITRDWKGKIIGLNINFGSEGLAKRHQANISTAVKQINELIEGRRELPFSVLDEAVRNATRALQNAQTELIFGSNGIVAKDKKNPNYLTILNSAGVGVSDDGGNTFRQAITGQGINASTIVTGTMVADFIAGGILSSLNGRTTFNLDDGKLSMDSTEFDLGGSALIYFRDYRNKIVYERFDSEDRITRTAGIGFGNSINDRFPVVYIGTSGTGKDGFQAVDDNWFTGFIANTNKRQSVDGVGNAVVGQRFHVRDKAIDFLKGFTFTLDGRASIYPINTGTYNYDLGQENNRFDIAYINRIKTIQDFSITNISDSHKGWRMETNYSGDGHGIAFYPLYPSENNYVIGKKTNKLTNIFSENVTVTYVNADYVNGTVVGTSTKNAKMGIEDVDGRKAFDYFIMMDVKSFFYKDGDYTNPYNRKVSPIIEQLDPTLKNLYKATDEGLDINSNLFLLAHAFKYDAIKTDERLKVLEAQVKALENKNREDNERVKYIFRSKYRTQKQSGSSRRTYRKGVINDEQTDEQPGTN